MGNPYSPGCNCCGPTSSPPPPCAPWGFCGRYQTWEEFSQINIYISYGVFDVDFVLTPQHYEDTDVFGKKFLHPYWASPRVAAGSLFRQAVFTGPGTSCLLTESIRVTRADGSPVVGNCVYSRTTINCSLPAMVGVRDGVAYYANCPYRSTSDQNCLSYNTFFGCPPAPAGGSAPAPMMMAAARAAGPDPEATCRGCDQLDPTFNHCNACRCPGCAWMMAACPLGKW